MVRLATAEKEFAAEPWWYFDSPQQDRYVLNSIPLSIDHIVEEGLFLEGNCYRDNPDAAVTLVLSYKPAQGFSGPLVRIDWKPLHAHKNRGLTKGEWRFKQITGTHIHPFAANFSLGMRRMWQENLPIAFPILDPLHWYRDLLEYAGTALCISGMQRTPPPEWSPRLT